MAELAQPHGPVVRPHQLSWPTTALASLAAVKVFVALLVATPLAPHVFDPSELIAQGAVNTLPWLVPGLLLLLVNSRQCRTGSLGVAMLLTSSRPSGGIISLLSAHVPFLPVMLAFVPAFFAPYYFGRFLLEFPQPRTGPRARWLAAATNLAGIVAAMQFVSIGARPFLERHPAVFAYRIIIGAVDARVAPLTTFSLCVLVLGLSVIDFGGLLPEDRRRHERLYVGWALVIAPLSFWVAQLTILDLRLNVSGGFSRPLNLLTLALNLSWTIAPTVIASRALEGRPGLLRDAMRRGVVILLNARRLALGAIVPITVVGVFAYRRQDQTVSAVFSRTAMAWIAVSAISTLCLLSRRQLLRTFNQWFFREHGDADDTLARITGRMRQSAGIDELVAHLCSGIDRMLRPYRTVMLVRDESATQFVPLSGSAEALPASSLLTDLLRAGRGVLDTPLAGGTSPMRWLPQDERYWLVGCGARLVVPLHGSDGSLNGLIAIGDRRNGRAYTDDDRRWLTSLAEAATMTIEARSKDHGSDANAVAWRVGLVERHRRALECEACGRIVEVGATLCPRCGESLTLSLVPHLLFGKFRFEQRIGRGGMGVVFRATDLTLERSVAVKMLPGATPEYSELLRHEARAMAAVTHRHLAVVYSVEAWRGQPLLVCEYMEHGTLADRLAGGAMPADDALAVGVSVAEALDVIHARQLLHRDIKPSNIGFDHARAPKLLDFGLAHVRGNSRMAAAFPHEARTAGTPLYMSPEAVAGAAPSPAVDLWGLHVMLHEAMTGSHPFRRSTTEATLDAIVRDPAPPLAATGGVSPDRAIRIAAYFSRALSKTADHRPRTAAETAAALRALMA